MSYVVARRRMEIAISGPKLEIIVKRRSHHLFTLPICRFGSSSQPSTTSNCAGADSRSPPLS